MYNNIFLDHDKQWIQSVVNKDEISVLTEQAKTPEILSKFFLSRGIRDVNYIDKFLNPGLEDLHNPFLIKDMRKAVLRIIKGIKNKEKIVIYGDYDVDGVTSTSILLNFFRELNVDVDFYIPDRVEEGYGLSIAGLEKVCNKAADLIISVDCGITAFDEIKFIKDYCKEANKQIDVIITDHHQCRDDECYIPEAYAVVNPNRPDCLYPFKNLCGAGVVYKLINAIGIELKLEDIHQKYLDLVAIATIADVVSLVDENRTIVKFGLERLLNTTNIGLKALIRHSGVKDGKIDTITIGYIIGPRINVAGRLGDAGRGVRLFTSNDYEEVERIAKELNEENRLRQDIQTQIFEEVVNNIEEDIEYNKDKILVVAGEEWHHGVIGIVASKITERYNKPTILISIKDGMGMGSGRSLEGFNIFKGLTYCKELFEKFGGHELAGGVTLKKENIEAFRKMINEYAVSIKYENILRPKIFVDAEIKKEDIQIDIVQQLEKLMPFGQDNESPIFVYKNLKIISIGTVGDNKHLKLRFEDSNKVINAIGFNMGDKLNFLSNNNTVDVICRLEINRWNGNENVKLNLIYIKQNYDELLKNKYYYSLEKTFMNSYEDVEKVPKDFNKKYISYKEFEYLFEKEYNRKNRLLILVNSLDSLRKLIKISEKSNLAIKKEINICYTYPNDNIDGLCIVVNPDGKEIELSNYHKIILLGYWFDNTNFRTIINKSIKLNIETIMCYENKNEAFDELIPSREDLAIIYKFIVKYKINENLEFKNTFIFLNKLLIETGYKINYFKFIKSLKIFSELNLLEIREACELQLLLEFNENLSKKMDLNDSKLYKKLNLLN